MEGQQMSFAPRKKAEERDHESVAQAVDRADYRLRRLLGIRQHDGRRRDAMAHDDDTLGRDAGRRHSRAIGLRMYDEPLHGTMPEVHAVGHGNGGPYERAAAWDNELVNGHDRGHAEAAREPREAGSPGRHAPEQEILVLNVHEVYAIHVAREVVGFDRAGHIDVLAQLRQEVPRIV